MRKCAWLVAFALWTAGAAAESRLATRAGWELGATLSDYHYEEPGVMWLKGGRLGINGAYTVTDQKGIYGRVEARWSYGELEYQGSGTLSEVPDQVLEMRLMAGRDYPVGENVLSPYAGLAFRYLYNDLRGVSTTGDRGYRRESFYFYLPVGITLRVPLGATWRFAPQVEYDVFVKGVQRSYLADTRLGYTNVDNAQQQGYGYRLQLMFEGGDWAIGPWMHYWSIKDSDIQPIGLGRSALEPANWTREAGVELRYRF